MKPPTSTNMDLMYKTTNCLQIQNNFEKIFYHNEWNLEFLLVHVLLALFVHIIVKLGCLETAHYLSCMFCYLVKVYLSKFIRPCLDE